MQLEWIVYVIYGIVVQTCVSMSDDIKSFPPTQCPLISLRDRMELTAVEITANIPPTISVRLSTLIFVIPRVLV